MRRVHIWWHNNIKHENSESENLIKQCIQQHQIFFGKINFILSVDLVDSLISTPFYYFSLTRKPVWTRDYNVSWFILFFFFSIHQFSIYYSVKIQVPGDERAGLHCATGMTLRPCRFIPMEICAKLLNRYGYCFTKLKAINFV